MILRSIRWILARLGIVMAIGFHNTRCYIQFYMKRWTLAIGLWRIK